MQTSAYVNLLQGMAALSISSAFSSAAPSPTPPTPQHPKAKRCLFPEMESIKPFYYPTVRTWIHLGRQWNFNISEEQAAKINGAIVSALKHLDEAERGNTWLPFDENLIISPKKLIYWRITSLTGCNKATQWKIIEVCSTRGFPPVSLQVLHLNPSLKEVELCQHFSGWDIPPCGLLSLEKVGNALVSRYMQDGCLEDSIGKASMTAARKISFAYQIAQGLQYLHQHGIAHRDISTRNIIIHGTQVNICDFGSACFVTEEKPEGLVPLHTSATEILLQLDSKDLALADLYALGIVYHCLFSSTTWATLVRSDPFCYGLILSFENFSMFSQKRSQITTWPGRASLPTDIEPIITKLLKESPGERMSLNVLLEMLGSRRSSSADQQD